MRTPHRGLLIGLLPGLLLVAACSESDDRPSERSGSATESTAGGSEISDVTDTDTIPTSLGDVGIIVDLEDGLGFRRVYAVAPRLSDAGLTELMTELHAAEPDAWWWLVDSDEQNDVLAESLPRTIEGDFDGYPGAWMEEHTVAHLVLESGRPEGRLWVLYAGPATEREIATFPYDGEYD